MPVWARSCGRVTAHYVYFSSQVTCEVLLHGDSSFGMSVEIIFQRANLPTHRANRLDRYRIHVGWNATQEKRGAHEVTRDQVTNDMFVPRHPHFPADKQRDTSHTFAMLDQSLVCLDCGSTSFTVPEAALQSIRERVSLFSRALAC